MAYLLLNALVSVWAKAVEQEVAGASPSAYADDVNVITCSYGQLQKAVRITSEYATLTGQVLNVKKSTWFTTVGGRMRPLFSHGQPLTKASSSVTTLGVQVSLKRLQRAGATADRVQTACLIAERAHFVPLPFELRAELTGSLAIPRALYGCEVERMIEKQETKLRGAVLKALWGTKRGR